MGVLSQGCTVRPADMRGRYDGKAGDEEARSHQDDEDDIDRDGDLESGSLEIDAEADYGSKGTCAHVRRGGESRVYCFKYPTYCLR